MDDLKIIKKQYGDKMKLLCRKLFPTILETPGLLSSLMLEHFQPSKFLYDDLVESNNIEGFKNYIYSFIDVEKNNTIVTNKTPYELLSEAGYGLYECKTEDDIQAFKKYYAPGEELCTFKGGRLNTCYVFFAVKKNVDNIRRKNFSNPRREDEYGTSVISIQFSRESLNTLSIKNRYNHKVNNPDNTFNNNLDNIILGLNESFAREYNLNFEVQESSFELPNYVNVNGKFYKYNYEINNIYYCPDNIIIDNFEVIDKYSKEPDRYIILDYFIIDLHRRTIELYDKKIGDTFGDSHPNIEKIRVIKEKKTIEIIYNGGKKAELIVNSKNQMTSYQNDYLLETKGSFLNNIEYLESFIAFNLIHIGFANLHDARKLINLIIPNAIDIDNISFYNVNALINLDITNMKNIGSFVFRDAFALKILNGPNIKKIGSYCFKNSDNITSVIVPSDAEMPDKLRTQLERLSKLEEDKNEPETNIKNTSVLFQPLAEKINTMIKNASYRIKEYTKNMVDKLGGRHK